MCISLRKDTIARQSQSRFSLMPLVVRSPRKSGWTFDYKGQREGGVREGSHLRAFCI